MQSTIIANEKKRFTFNGTVELERKTSWLTDFLRTSTSDVFRKAIEEYYEKVRQEMIERELEDGYKSNYKYYAKMNQEWEFADSE
ncbi:MAG: hypothetical protein ABR936_04570 [Bacteroidota bacterium]|jgi:hypothetical protein